MNSNSKLYFCSSLFAVNLPSKSLVWNLYGLFPFYYPRNIDISEPIIEDPHSWGLKFIDCMILLHCNCIPIFDIFSHLVGNLDEIVKYLLEDYILKTYNGDSYELTKKDRDKSELTSSQQDIAAEYWLKCLGPLNSVNKEFSTRGKRYGLDLAIKLSRILPSFPNLLYSRASIHFHLLWGVESLKDGFLSHTVEFLSWMLDDEQITLSDSEKGLIHLCLGMTSIRSNILRSSSFKSFDIESTHGHFEIAKSLLVNEAESFVSYHFDEEFR
jgi:hypothetical protein